MVYLGKGSMETGLWTPSALELTGPHLAQLAIELQERDGLATAEIVGLPQGSDIGEEVSRFLRLASNALKR